MLFLGAWAFPCFAEAVEYKSLDLRDPFVSIAPRIVKAAPAMSRIAEEGVPDFQLSGVVWSGRKPQAIINEEVLGIGDAVLDYEVLMIEKAGVKLRKGEREVYLTYSPTMS